VTLVVTDNSGAADPNPPTRVITVNPPNQAPTGTITQPATNVTISAGQAVSFAGTGSDPDGTIASYAWSFPGGTPSSSSAQNAGAITFSTPGIYIAKLTVTDNLGTADPNPPTRTVTVNGNQPPTGTITQPANNVSINAGQSVTFAGNGTDPDGTIASYAWSLPGGTPSSSAAQNPGAVTFSTAGTYTAKLTVKDNLGAVDPNPPTRTITVAAQTTAATPTFSPVAGTYTTVQIVSISSTTPNAKIYYTADNTTPTTSSKLYTGPINISTSTTIKALATSSGYKNSAVGTATYVVQAQGCACPSFNNGFVAGVLQLNSPATINGTRLRLTNGGANQASSTYFKTPVNIQSFTNDFSFLITNPGADGFTFVIQNATLTAKGDLGGGLGYGPDPEDPSGPFITKSVAVKFDLYDNLGEGANSTGLYQNGASPALPSTSLSPLDISAGHVVNVHMVYDGTTLMMTATDATDVTKSVTKSYTVDIPATVGANTAYIGFTGGTGGLSATQDILTWQYVH
jgi:PKD repeat protein